MDLIAQVYSDLQQASQEGGEMYHVMYASK